MLTNEYFGITIQIANDFDMLFENVRLSVNVPVHLRSKGMDFFLFFNQMKFSIMFFFLSSQFSLHPIYQNHVRNWYRILR